MPSGYRTGGLGGGGTGNFSGVDTRALFARTDAGVRVNNNVSMGAVLTDNDDTYYNALSVKLEAQNYIKELKNQSNGKVPHSLQTV